MTLGISNTSANTFQNVFIQYQTYDLDDKPLHVGKRVLATLPARSTSQICVLFLKTASPFPDQIHIVGVSATVNGNARVLYKFDPGVNKRVLAYGIVAPMEDLDPILTTKRIPASKSLSSPLIASATHATSANARTTFSASMKVSETPLVFHFGADNLYVIDNQLQDPREKKVPEPPLTTGLIVAEVNGRTAINNKYFKSGEETQSITFTSSDPAIINFSTSRNGEYEVLSPGQVDVSANVGTQSVKIHLNVQKIPARKYMDIDQLIKSLGVPDEETKRYLSWPDSSTIDGLYYKTRDGKGMTVYHWKFKRYTGAVLRLYANGTLESCENPEVENLKLLQWELDHK